MFKNEVEVGKQGKFGCAVLPDRQAIRSEPADLASLKLLLDNLPAPRAAFELQAVLHSRWDVNASDIAGPSHISNDTPSSSFDMALH